MRGVCTPKTNLFGGKTGEKLFPKPKLVLFQADFFGFVFGTASARKQGSIFGYIDVRKGGRICIVTCFHACWEAKNVDRPKTAVRNLHNMRQVLCCAPLPTRARLRHYDQPIGPDSDGDHSSKALVVQSTFAALYRNAALIV